MAASDPEISQADEDEAREHAYMLITLALHHEPTAPLLADMPNPEYVAAVILGAFEASWEWLARIVDRDPLELWRGYRGAAQIDGEAS